MNPSDPINTTIPAGQQAATSTFGYQRDIADAQRTFGDQLQQLEGEKISLMKRLNMVLSELEKATHEKSDISAKLRQQERLADELKHKLEEISGLKNVVNRNLQEDLRYERDLNQKLREELDRFEREKETLLAKLKEEEDLSQQIQRETHAINTNLLRRTDDLRALEQEHDQTSRRLAQLNDELEALRNQEVKTRQQKALMDSQLAELTTQRNDLIRRMNELSDRYETYVNTMNRERQEISRQNKVQVKSLVAKLLVQVLNENLQKKRKNAFLEINSTSKQMANLERCLTKLNRVVSKYLGDSKRRYLRLWYRNAFNCVYETKRRNQLIDGSVSFKRSQKFFYLWRQAFLRNRKTTGEKTEAIKQFRRVVLRRAEHNQRHYLCRWRDFVERRQAQNNFLYGVVQRRRERQLRRAYVLWLSFCKRDSLLQRYERISDIVTETWFKQRVFLGLKHACQQQRAESACIKFNTWKNWCETARNKRYFEKKELLIQKIENIRTERLIKKVFDSIRFGNIQRKFENTKNTLNDKIPEKQELEYRKECLIKNSSGHTKLHVLRQCYLRHCDHMYKALLIWKNCVVFHKQVLHRLKLRLIDEHKRRLRIAFMRWKESTDKRIHFDLLKVTEDHMNENQNLINELNAKKLIQREQQMRAARQQIQKLERVRNMFNRKMLRRCYYLWVGGAQRMNDLERGVFITAKTVLRHRTRNNFIKFRNQCAAEKRKAFIDQKCEWFEAQRKQVCKRDVWYSWIMFIKRFKLGKKFLERGIMGINRNYKFATFAKWKKVMANMTLNMYNENIRELQRRQKEHQRSIAKVENDIQIAHNVKQHTINQMKSLGKKVMANFITRATHMQVARGFFTWVDTTNNWNKKRRLLKMALVYWIKTDTANAFRKWAQYNYKTVEVKLKDDLFAKEKTRKILVRQGQQEQAEQELDEAKLTTELREAVLERDGMQRNFEKAFETHVSRVKNNVYIEKRRNILNTWRDFVRREKNAVNVIGAIARRTLRIEVFRRIRMAAREKYLDKNAERICTNFWSMLKHSNLKKAFSRWRQNSFQLCVKEKIAAELRLRLTRQTHIQEIVRITEQKQIRAAHVIAQKQTRRVNLAFKEMTKFLKALRVKQSVLQQNLAFLNGKKAMQKWHLRTELTLMIRRRQEQVCKAYKLMKLKICWQAIKRMISLQKRAGKKFAQVLERMQYFDTAAFFQKWQQFTISEGEKDKRSKKHGTQTLGLILDRLVKRRQAIALHSLRNRTQKKEFKERYLRRTLSHCATYRLRHYFQRWHHQKECYKIAETVNTEGRVVMRRNEYMRNAKAMKEYLLNAGYTNEAIEEYVKTKSNIQKNNMQKGIIALFFKNSDFNVVPKALNAWKDFVLQRKKIRQTCQFVMNHLKHPLAGWFQRWKFDAADSQRQIMNLTKQQLIDKIVQDENLIGSTESRLQRMDEAIDNLAIQRENLLGHYIRGQKLAITLRKNNYLKTYFRAFLRWKRYSQEYENMRLIEQLERTNQMIAELSNHVGKLEQINRNLLTENEELRQAALDGIEIAKVVQELTRERENLSHDLADRAGTIKKLIEDNNNLSVRLSIAQREAAQLEQMNQQMYLAPPERDYHR